MVDVERRRNGGGVERDPKTLVIAGLGGRQQKDKHRASMPNLGLPTLQLPIGPFRRCFSYRSSEDVIVGRTLRQLLAS